jgi:hypothetical protein
MRALVTGLFLVTANAPLRAQERLQPVTEAVHLGVALAPRAVLTALTIPALVAVLEEQGMPVDRVLGDTLALARVGATRVLFQLLNDGQVVHAAFAAGTRPDPAAVNAWNRGMILSRAWLKGDGTPVCEADLDLEGGVTGARLRDFLRTVAAMVPEFARRMPDVAIGGRAR